jgi:hypothetical protein
VIGDLAAREASVGTEQRFGIMQEQSHAGSWHKPSVFSCLSGSIRGRSVFLDPESRIDPNGWILELQLLQ